jgi:DNA-directed RNA polymerase specialized sigma24 family protein
VAVPAAGALLHAEAVGDLYARHHRQIYNFCWQRLGSRDDAEDATQRMFLNAFHGLSRGVSLEFESAWLFKIAENVCLNQQRSSARACPGAVGRADEEARSAIARRARRPRLGGSGPQEPPAAAVRSSRSRRPASWRPLSSPRRRRCATAWSTSSPRRATPP